MFRFVVNAVLCVLVWAFLTVVIEVTSAPLQSNTVKSETEENFPRNGIFKSSLSILADVREKYWSKKKNVCGSSDDEVLFDICRMYYYGKLSTFRDGDFILDTSNRKTSQMDCCLKPCTRWVIKDKCQTNPEIYHPSKPRPTTTTTTPKPTTSTQNPMQISGKFQCYVFSSLCTFCSFGCDPAKLF